MNNDIAVEPLGHDLLHEFTHTLNEADQLVCLGEAVVWVARLIKHNDRPFVPGVDATVNSSVEDVGEGVGARGVGPCEEAVAHPAGPRCQRGHRDLEGRGDLGGGDGRPGSGVAGRRVSVLVVIHQ